MFNTNSVNPSICCWFRPIRIEIECCGYFSFYFCFLPLSVGCRKATVVENFPNYFVQNLNKSCMKCVKKPSYDHLAPNLPLFCVFVQRPKCSLFSFFFALSFIVPVSLDFWPEKVNRLIAYNHSLHFNTIIKIDIN